MITAFQRNAFQNNAFQIAPLRYGAFSTPQGYVRVARMVGYLLMVFINVL